MPPTNLTVRILPAIVLTVAFVIVCLWWYYRPTIERAGLSSRTESISIGSISINTPYLLPSLLTVIVVGVVLFVLLQLFR
jgi:hypothetical protein